MEAPDATPLFQSFLQLVIPSYGGEQSLTLHMSLDAALTHYPPKEMSGRKGQTYQTR